MKTKLQHWGAALFALGGASFILPLTGMQSRIFNLFGGASPAVSIGVMVLGGVLWLVGTLLGASARTQTPKPSPVTGSPVPPPATPAMSSRSITKCPKCGQSVGPNDRFCMECGNPVPEEVAPPTPPLTERPTRAIGRRTGLWVLLGFSLAALMALILGGAIALWLTTSGWRLIPVKTAVATPPPTPAVDTAFATPAPTPAVDSAFATPADTPAVASEASPAPSAEDNGEVQLVSLNNDKQTRAINKPHVRLIGSNNTVVFTGVAELLEIEGSNNDVEIDQVSEVIFYGSNNDVTYKQAPSSGDVVSEQDGADNDVEEED